MVLRPMPGDPLRDLAAAKQFIEAEKLATTHLREVADLLSGLPATKLAEIAAELQRIRQDRGVLYVFGDEGSADIAFHLSTDLARSHPSGELPLRVVCLSGEAAHLSDSDEDNDLPKDLDRRFKGRLRNEDAVLAISASGRSAPCLEALSHARAQGVRTLGLLGSAGGPARPLCDIHLLVPHSGFLPAEDIHRVVCQAFSRILCSTAAVGADRQTLVGPSSRDT